MFDPNLNHLDLYFNEIYKNLDIPKNLLEVANQRYMDLANWLKEDSEKNFKTNSLLYPQGSILLGTSVMPVKARDDFDFDLVYRRDLLKESITQKELKKQVGDQLKAYIEFLKKTGSDDIPSLIEGKRCWTLKYPKFHMDILPALPDQEGDYNVNKDDGIIITDKDLHHWQFSNPKGYNAWFKNEMRQSINEEKVRLAKASTLDIEEIQDEDIKTTLQKAIQILKRHRDSTYTGVLADKPISVIINTLATKSYKHSPNVYQTLQDILAGMDQHFEIKSGVYWVVNPINPKENFADKWVNHPERRTAFNSWLKAAREEFMGLEKKGSFVEINERLQKSLGNEVVSEAWNSLERTNAKKAALNVAVSNIKTPTKPWVP